MAEFDNWADYYDIVHRGLPGEAEFYVEESIRQGGETLELGCGTGRVCIPMAMCGAQVTGLDISSGMLRIASRKFRKVGPVKGKLSLLRGDMRAFDLGKQFRFIALPYRGFMHLLNSADQVACLRCVRQHLEPGGRFVFNVWAAKPSTIAAALSNPRTRRLKPVGRYRAPWADTVLMHSHAANYDEYRQLISERHVIREVDDSGRVLKKDELTLTRAWTTPREMEHLLCRCGFTIEGVYQDFEGTPLDEGAHEMVWVLQRDGKDR